MNIYVVIGFLAILLFIIFTLVNRYENIKKTKVNIIWGLKRISTNVTMHTIIESDILHIIPENTHVFSRELFFYKRAEERLSRIEYYVRELELAAEKIIEVDKLNIYEKINLLRKNLSMQISSNYNACEKIKEHIIKKNKNSELSNFSKKQMFIIKDSESVMKLLEVITQKEAFDQRYLLELYSSGVCQIARLNCINVFD